MVQNGLLLKCNEGMGKKRNKERERGTEMKRTKRKGGKRRSRKVPKQNAMTAIKWKWII